MPFPAIFLQIAQGGANTTLRSPGMGPCWVELGNHCYLGATTSVQGGHQTSTARADYNGIECMSFDVVSHFSGFFFRECSKIDIGAKLFPHIWLGCFHRCHYRIRVK
jgi:hypothetical protein